MPDWTYQTLLKPPLASLGFDNGSAIALGSMGRLASLPGGKFLIQLMGHMHPDPRLSIERAGFVFETRVGIGCRIDPRMFATRAFAEFGVGFIEVGPVVKHASGDQASTEIDFAAETIRLGSQAKFLNCDEVATRCDSVGPLPMPLIARLAPESVAAASPMIEKLHPHVDGFVVPTSLLSPISELLLRQTELPPKLLFGAIDQHNWEQVENKSELIELLKTGVVAGLSVSTGPLQMGKAGFTESVELMADLRRKAGPEPLLIGAVGVHAPVDALDYLDAGADLVQVDSGLAFTGPSLPKRINEAVLYREVSPASEESLDLPLPQQSWFWSFVMGLGMFVGGLLAMVIALTRVVMPYDESLVGMLRDELININDRLLPFMQHDRVTLAGTMLAIGVLYMSFSFYGIRHGAKWAYIAVAVSATTGFFSFFTFLGFGYFDPFHAFVSAVLLQFLLLTTILPQPRHRKIEMPELWNDFRWRIHQWGQLAFVIHGAVLVFAGLVISGIGMTSVFVPEDLEFLRCSERLLTDTNPMLVPLVAHDRATFGGMLIATGIVTLLAALWGFRHGQAWLWWALMIAGSLAYTSAIGIHWVVGYDSLKHLIPAYGGLVLLGLGGLASYPFMVRTDPQLAAEWQRRCVKKPCRSSAGLISTID